MLAGMGKRVPWLPWTVVGAVAFSAWWLWRRASGGTGEVVAFPVPSSHWPVVPKLLFGYQRTAAHRHQGVDIPAPVGAPVVAAVGGRVVHVCKSGGCPGFSGYGNVIVIEAEPTNATPRLWFLYAHLSRVGVYVGQTVATGESIGAVGDVCGTTDDPSRECGGAHLHFESSPNHYPQDSEATRYDPKKVFAALESTRPPVA